MMYKSPCLRLNQKSRLRERVTTARRLLNLIPSFCTDENRRPTLYIESLNILICKEYIGRLSKWLRLINSVCVQYFIAMIGESD